MFFFNLSSDDLDQLASVSKSLVTRLLALPKVKSLELTETPEPKAIACVESPEGFELVPTIVQLSPVVIPEPAPYPTPTLLPPVVT